MPMRRCGDCNRLYDLDTAPGRRCPACQQNSERQRDQRRGNSTQRGYGGAHKAERERQIAAFSPGQPCARCGRPIASVDDADLGHDDNDRSRYQGLEHRRCNRGAPHRTGGKPRATRPVLPTNQLSAGRQASSSAGSDDSDDDWCGIL